MDPYVKAIYYIMFDGNKAAYPTGLLINPSSTTLRGSNTLISFQHSVFINKYHHFILEPKSIQR